MSAKDTMFGYRKSTVFAFVACAVMATVSQILLPYSGAGKIILNILFAWPFMGLVLINILLFAIPLYIGLGRMIKNRVKGNSQKQENQQDEKELKELLQGDRIGKSEMPDWARIGVAICIGLIAGSILGCILNRNIM